LRDETIPKVKRLAFELLRNPVLDYRAVGEAFWKGQPPTVNRNRMNALLTHLKQQGVIESLGGAHFRVNRDRMTELWPVTGDDPSATGGAG
jgi:hypothetical protein